MLRNTHGYGPTGTKRQFASLNETLLVRNLRKLNGQENLVGNEEAVGHKNCTKENLMWPMAREKCAKENLTWSKAIKKVQRKI